MCVCLHHQLILQANVQISLQSWPSWDCPNSSKTSRCNVTVSHRAITCLSNVSFYFNYLYIFKIINVLTLNSILTFHPSFFLSFHILYSSAPCSLSGSRWHSLSSFWPSSTGPNSWTAMTRSHVKTCTTTCPLTTSGSPRSSASRSWVGNMTQRMQQMMFCSSTI